jgi:hypothetical protein
MSTAYTHFSVGDRVDWEPTRQLTAMERELKTPFTIRTVKTVPLEHRNGVGHHQQVEVNDAEGRPVRSTGDPSKNTLFSGWWFRKI